MATKQDQRRAFERALALGRARAQAFDSGDLGCPEVRELEAALPLLRVAAEMADTARAVGWPDDALADAERGLRRAAEHYAGLALAVLALAVGRAPSE